MKLEGFYCVKGRTLRGKDAWIGRDVYESGGWPYFADRIEDADMTLSAVRVIGIQSSVAKRMKTYHRGDDMDLGSFAVYEMSLEAKLVEVDDSLRTRLRGDALLKAPEGWSFMLINAEARTFATPDRHWSRRTETPAEAVRFTDLAAAAAALDKLGGHGFQIFVTCRVASAEPIPADVLTAKIEEERQARESEGTRVAELPEGDTYKPF